MNDRNHDAEKLDKVIDGIRRADLDDQTVASATERVWQRIATGVERPITGCGDYQRLIPDLVGGRLSEARALLVSDHTRECVACRRALLEARSGQPAAARPHVAATRRTVPRWARLAAAAAVAIGFGLVGFVALGNFVIDERLTATVDSADGTIQRVERIRTEELANGDAVGSGQLLRTSRDSGAQLVLADGSLVEIAPRSELELHGALRGTTVRLRRGNIIVHAADQGEGRLYVATDDCLVAVRGTIFAVDHGLKGSRVSVLEGEVEVRRHGQTDLLAPGEQVTTRASLEAVSIEDQVAWSPHAKEHIALLHELSRLRREIVDAIEPRTPRTSSRLLDLVPADTIVYLALPNLTEGLGEARGIVEQRIAASPVLQAWWQEHVVAAGIDRELNDMLDRLQPLGKAVGDEVVITLSTRTLDGSGGPVMLALLDDPESFASLLEDEVARANAAAAAPVLDLVSDPSIAAPATAELAMTVDGDLFIAAADRSQLLAIADRGESAAGDFASSELRSRLEEAYSHGVSWVAGIDLHRVMERAIAESTGDTSDVMERLGLLDAATVVVSSSRSGDQRTLDAAVDFDGPRRGVAAWLADPAPMGSLDFVSPGASFAAAAITKDAAVMLDELLAALAAHDAEAMNGLAEFERVVGIDLRDDLVATLGGEGAFAIDGPVLPVPTWKLILEVYDPATLMSAIERSVAEMNRQMAEHGHPPISLDEVEVSGRHYLILRHPSSSAELALLAVDGYLVVAPGTAVIEQALQYRSSGVTLPRSAAFQELLPRNGYTDCSAVVWRNLDSLLASVPDAALDQLPPEARTLIEESGGAGLVCAYGTRNRILATGSGDGLLSGMPMLGIAGLLHAAPQHHADSANPVSSSG